MKKSCWCFEELLDNHGIVLFLVFLLLLFRNSHSCGNFSLISGNKEARWVGLGWQLRSHWFYGRCWGSSTLDVRTLALKCEMTITSSFLMLQCKHLMEKPSTLVGTARQVHNCLSLCTNVENKTEGPLFMCYRWTTCLLLKIYKRPKELMCSRSHTAHTKVTRLHRQVLPIRWELLGPRPDLKVINGCNWRVQSINNSTLFFS